MPKDRTSMSQDYRSRLDGLTENILNKSSFTISQIQDTLKITTELKLSSQVANQNQQQIQFKITQLTVSLSKYQKYLAQLNTLLLRTEFFEDQLTLLETDIAGTIHTNSDPSWNDLNLRTIESTLENLCHEFKHLSKKIESLTKQNLMEQHSIKAISPRSDKIIKSFKYADDENDNSNVDDIIANISSSTPFSNQHNTSLNDNKENIRPVQLKRHSYSNNRHSYGSIQRTSLTPRTPLSRTFNANDFNDDDDDNCASDNSDDNAEKFMSQLKPIRCVSQRKSSAIPSESSITSATSIGSGSLNLRRVSARNSVNSNKFNLLASIPGSHSQSRSARNSRLIDGMDLSSSLPAVATVISGAKKFNLLSNNNSVTKATSKRHSRLITINTIESSGLNSSFQSTLFSRDEMLDEDGLHSTQTRSSSIDESNYTNANSKSPIKVKTEDLSLSPLASKNTGSQPLRQLKFKAKSIANFPDRLGLNFTSDKASPDTELSDPFSYGKRKNANLRHFSSHDTGLKLNYSQESLGSDVDVKHTELFGDYMDGVKQKKQKEVIQEEEDEDTTNDSVIILEKEHQSQEKTEQVEDFRAVLQQHEQQDEFDPTFEHKLNRSNSLDSVFSTMTSKIPIAPPKKPSHHHPYNQTSSAFQQRQFSKPTLTWMRNIAQSSTSSVSSLNKVTMISVNTPSTKTFALNSKTKQNLSNLLTSQRAASAVTTTITDAERVVSGGSFGSIASALPSSATTTGSSTSGGSGGAAAATSLLGRIFSSGSSSRTETEVKPSALSSLNKTMVRHKTSLQSFKDAQLQQVKERPSSIKSKALKTKQSLLSFPSTSTSSPQEQTSSTKPITINHTAISDYHSFETPAPPSSKYIANAMLDSFITTINSYIPTAYHPHSEIGVPLSSSSKVQQSPAVSVKTHYLQTHSDKQSSTAVASTSSSLKFVSSSNHAKLPQGTSKLIIAPNRSKFIQLDYRGSYKGKPRNLVMTGLENDQGTEGLRDAINEGLV